MSAMSIKEQFEKHPVGGAILVFGAGLFVTLGVLQTLKGMLEIRLVSEAQLALYQQGMAELENSRKALQDKDAAISILESRLANAQAALPQARFERGSSGAESPRDVPPNVAADPRGSVDYSAYSKIELRIYFPSSRSKEAASIGEFLGSHFKRITMTERNDCDRASLTYATSLGIKAATHVASLLVSNGTREFQDPVITSTPFGVFSICIPELK